MQKKFSILILNDYKTRKKTPNGRIKDASNLDLGFWESKDEYDILEEEIDRKLAKYYPNDNIFFEDSQTAVLIQAGAKKIKSVEEKC